MRKNLFVWLSCLVWLLILGLHSASAGDRALIIAIGQAYEKAGISVINGPAHDADLALELANNMRFKSDEIKLLKEDQATSQAILQGLDWLEQGPGSGDRAFLFYSGHGSQVGDRNGDEEDGCDEVLVPADCSSPDMLVLDDRIGQCLSALSRAQVVVIVDSCFSGTINKGLYLWSDVNTKYYAKSQASCGKPVNVKSIGVTEESGDSGAVVLTATAQNEVAYGNLGEGRGSLFTSSLYETLRSRGSSVTFQELRDESARRIREICESKELIPHTPQIYGDPSMYDKTLTLASGPSQPDGLDGVRSNAELMERLMTNSKFMVSIRARNRDISIGQEITFEVASSKDGYLNLVELEPNGNLNVIFPNSFKQENRVRADQEVAIPRDIGGFRFVAVEPPGASQIVALVTAEPLNLYENREVGEKIGGFKAVGRNDTRQMKSALTRSISVQPEKSGDKEFGATGIKIRVR